VFFLRLWDAPRAERRGSLPRARASGILPGEDGWRIARARFSLIGLYDGIGGEGWPIPPP
jgi:hypothetical protein